MNLFHIPRGNEGGGSLCSDRKNARASSGFGTIVVVPPLHETTHITTYHAFSG
jgi:hypothetical protein